MVERIYDTLKGILWTDFPKDASGTPAVYNRRVTQWMFGDRDILPAPLGIVIKEPKSSFKDIGYGLRKITYSITIVIYSSNDDKETSERIVQEAARIANASLKDHRTIWVCELCPICEKLPLSPIHYIDSGVITNVGITTAILPANQTSYTVSVNGNPTGFAGTAYIRLSRGISGKMTSAEILSCGLGITSSSYTDAYSTLTFTLSSGSAHPGYAQTVLNNYARESINTIYEFWGETHASGIPQYVDWAGVAYNSVQRLMSDWSAGFKPTSFTSVANVNDNFNSLVSGKVELVRVLQDIQVSEVNNSDDGMGAALLHKASFTIVGDEIVSVDKFGPNNVNVNAV